MPETLNSLIAARANDLERYQNPGYAARYRKLVEGACQAEETRAAGLAGFGWAVARYAYKLLAYKDEYEVARLYTDGEFTERLARTFEGPYQLKVHLAPPLFSTRDPDSGLPRKRAYGPWMLKAMKGLAGLRFLRGTGFDPFGYTVERRGERRRLSDYEKVIEELILDLHHDNHALATEIASLPDGIRGYGHIKQQHIELVTVRQTDLLARWRGDDTRAVAV